MSGVVTGEKRNGVDKVYLFVTALKANTYILMD